MAGFLLMGLIILDIMVVPCFTCESHDETLKTGAVRVAAFNIKHFGRGLMRKEPVVAAILKIFKRYDVVLVQEVRDSTNTAIRDLNRRLSATGEAWHYVESDSLGRNKFYREQYVFLYKNSSVRYMGSHQVDDSARDVYEREPFAVNFEYNSVTTNCKQRVVLAALHSKPTSAREELEEFASTLRYLSSISPNASGVVGLGDLNADCRYLRRKDRASLQLFSDPKFTSLIPDTADTTVSKNTDCAYDRVVVFGDVGTRGGAVFNFQTVLGLDDTQAAAVSDHYPVEFFLL